MSNLIIEQIGKIQLITLNRPEAMNALSPDLMNELCQTLAASEDNPEVAVVVLTGSDKAFAAGADIKAMKDMSYMQMYQNDFVTKDWERIATFRKPTIAAVAGFALGGGCELAMMCDFIIAAENARFGQPEIKLGVMPGAGGTQRLPRAIGKAKAMEMCLTGRLMDAIEAEKSGLVARIVPAEKLLDEALATAQAIAGYSLPVAMMIKEAVNRTYESSLAEGLLFERRGFHANFGLEDQEEGMAAFLEKRSPVFRHR